MNCCGLKELFFGSSYGALITKLVDFIQDNQDRSISERKLKKVIALYERWYRRDCHTFEPYEADVIYYILVRMYHGQFSDSKFFKKILLGMFRLELHVVDYVLPSVFLEDVLVDIQREFLVSFIEYFLTEANTHKISIGEKRIQDLVIDLATGSHVCELILECGTPEMFMLFTKYGALLTDAEVYIVRMIKIIIKYTTTAYDARFTDADKNKQYERLKNFGEILMRICPQLERSPLMFRKFKVFPKLVSSLSLWKFVNEEVLMDLDTRILTPAPLKHLSKLCIRKNLFKNWQLPKGIEALPLPKSLKEYVNLELPPVGKEPSHVPKV